MNINNDEFSKQRILGLLIEDPSMILLLKSKYITDDIWQFCIEHEPSLFKHMKNPSLDMCYFALEMDGHNLKYIRHKFKDIKITRKMAYIAISNCPKAIFYVPKDILDDGLKELAFELEPQLMKDFIYIRPEYVKKVIENNPTDIKYINNPDENLICEALIKEPNICLYFDTLTPKMKKAIEENHPQLIPFITNYHDE